MSYTNLFEEGGNAANLGPDGLAAKRPYVGTIVGESTSREFRMALSAEAVREQDIVAVEAEFQSTSGGTPERVLIWAKVARIERLNPLFPSEAGHELAATQTNPLDTVLSLSREMVTAVCQVLGTESIESPTGKLDHLRYPGQPAASVFRPTSEDIARIVLGDLTQKSHRAIDLATLANRPEVSVTVDGHAIVSRHLAILAMTGAGKSVTSRRIIEELGIKKFPIVIFDPHGEYAGLSNVASIQGRVDTFHADFPVFELDDDDLVKLVSSLGYTLTPAMEIKFTDVFAAAKAFLKADDSKDQAERVTWLSNWLSNSKIAEYGVKPNLFLIGDIAEAAERACATSPADPPAQAARQAAQAALQPYWPNVSNLGGTDSKTLKGISMRCRKAAASLRRMELTNQKIATGTKPVPKDYTELVKPGRISVVSLAGYTGEIQATLFSFIVDSIFESKMQGKLRLPVLLVLEEAHNFAPAKSVTDAEIRSITSARTIAQEGRKFGIGLVLISQRPSRLDETTLSMCNSYIVMRMVNPADQSFVRRVIESLGEDDVRMLPDLDVGEALLSGQMINFPVLARIKKPVSVGEREEEDAFLELEKLYKEMDVQA